MIAAALASSPPALPGFLDALSSPLQHYGVWAIGLLIMLEDFGIPVPGETILIAGAVYAGAGRLNVLAVGVVGFIVWRLRRRRRRLALAVARQVSEAHESRTTGEAAGVMPDKHEAEGAGSDKHEAAEAAPGTHRAEAVPDANQASGPAPDAT